MKLRLMGPAIEIVQALAVVRRCPRIEVATASDLLPTRGGRSGPRWVRAYVDAAVRAQTEPCCAPTAAEWVGETTGPAGPVHLWTCRDCGGTWTTTTRRTEVPR